MDDNTFAVEVHLPMTRSDLRREFQYKYFVREKGKDGEYEFFGEQYRGHHNRLLNPNLNLIFDQNGTCKF